VAGAGIGASNHDPCWIRCPTIKSHREVRHGTKPHSRHCARLEIPMIDLESLLEKIATAKEDISEAEQELEKAVEEIQASPRAHKTTVNKVVEDAITKLKAAKTKLEGLERLIDEDTG
jgi:guanylate kinase